MNVGTIDGEIAPRLGCDNNELQGQRWREFVQDDDFATILRMGADLSRRDAGLYPLKAIPRDGGRLYLSIQTFVDQDPTLSMRGALYLEAWESPRAYSFLKGACLCGFSVLSLLA